MKKLKPLIVTFAVLTLLFIWTNSFLSAGMSSRASGYFTRIMTPLLELVFGRGNVTEHLVRKLAHFTEYAFFGLWLALWMKADDRKALYALLAGFVTAFIDETIQMFTGRGPSIKDVWIDLFGVTAGIGFIHIVIAIVRCCGINIKNKKEAVCK